MRLLDLFCGAGGAAAGYAAAGFEVVGVDWEHHPTFPYQQVTADALAVLDDLDYLATFDVVHASPPCQAYSDLAARWRGNTYPDLVALVRDKLRAADTVYVIENVEGAPLRDPVTLCGSMFGLAAVGPDGVRRQLRRHRLFESNVVLTAPGPCTHWGDIIGVYGHGGGGQQARGYKATRSEAVAALGIHWMRIEDLAQAIPPAYTQHLGKQLASKITTGQHHQPTRLPASAAAWSQLSLMEELE